MSSETYNLPVIIEEVPGATVDRVMRGDRALLPAYVASARKLVERGAVAITSNCGFAVRFQAPVAEAVNVPVILSTLVLLPSMLRQYPESAMIGIGTFDSTSFAEDLLVGVDPADRQRVVVGGIEGGHNLRNAALGKATPPEQLEEDVAALIARMLAAKPQIRALLFTCTNFPVITPAIRARFGLPIYDITTCGRLTLESAVSAGLVHAPASSARRRPNQQSTTE
ncbi:hypothetical protein CVM73_35210 [Bradyrhizobium forestalis]|uniref:Aspartate/glutamate racemase family protein n=2 Tax=Bradyrhizobium forestalis TaxID=1419263 RepID=A0A2M8QYJ2_9BRAD|nr:hypothetical protein CVM73_35210 [Bradyrhizobium forestalis]